MSGLEQIVEQFESCDVTGELWIDGSFVAKKIDPEDVDALLCVDANLYDTWSPKQQDAVDEFESANLKTSHHCDSYVLREYSKAHPLHNQGEWDRSYWIKQFGFSRGEDRKGIVSVEIRPRLKSHA